MMFVNNENDAIRLVKFIYYAVPKTLSREIEICIKKSYTHVIGQAASVRPKRVNTEITETEISVWFTEPKPIIPNRIS